MDIQIRTAAMQELEQMARCQTRAFNEREPMTMALGFTHEEYYRYLLKMLPLSIEDGLSFNAVDVAAGKIAGTLILFDAFIDESRLPELTQVEIKGVVNTNLIFEELEKPLLACEFFKDGQCVRMMFISVEEGYLRFGMASKLLSYAEEMIRQKGYKIAIVDATNFRSAGLLEKHKYKKINEVTYSRIKTEGSNPFALVEDSCRLYIKRL
ncbi:MAG: GNAT family N-acetyltransferase [Desulfotomaculaceae bacterium]|nr:GNAT family N-acetyltransferase [Desulfotomaculaceae bacterium]